MSLYQYTGLSSAWFAGVWNNKIHMFEAPSRDLARIRVPVGGLFTTIAPLALTKETFSTQKSYVTVSSDVRHAIIMACIVAKQAACDTATEHTIIYRDFEDSIAKYLNSYRDLYIDGDIALYSDRLFWISGEDMRSTHIKKVHT